MKRSPAAALACLVLLAACAATCPDAPSQATQQRFACPDGSRLDVTFDRSSGRALVSEDGGAALSLAVQVAGLGYRYSGDGAELRSGTQPGEVEWTPPSGDVPAPGAPTPDRPSVTCTVVN